MTTYAPWIAWISVGGATGAALADLATRRIPNWLTASVLVIALAYHGAHGAVECLQSLGIAALVLILGTYLHARGWLGGGDVKLAAGLAAGFALPGAIDFVLYTLLSGGVLALASIIVVRRRTIGAQATALAVGLIAGSVPNLGSAGMQRIPYAVAMAFGAALAACAYSVPALRLA